MPKQNLGHQNENIKYSIQLQKRKNIYEERKKLLRENLKKRKNKKNLIK
tara:strand:+ start:381 stop:527 length:147 start_codon:yes stop_codon:yes gene_type:complete